jgi:hypothetical protein
MNTNFWKAEHAPLFQLRVYSCSFVVKNNYTGLTGARE